MASSNTSTDLMETNSTGASPWTASTFSAVLVARRGRLLQWSVRPCASSILTDTNLCSSVLGVGILFAVALIQELFGSFVGIVFRLEGVVQGFERIVWHSPSLCEVPSVGHDFFTGSQQSLDVGHARL
jgi:hypothetical protein